MSSFAYRYLFLTLILAIFPLNSGVAGGDHGDDDDAVGDDDDSGDDDDHSPDPPGDDDDVSPPGGGGIEDFWAVTTTVLAEQRDGACPADYQGALVPVPYPSATTGLEPPAPQPLLTSVRPDLWQSESNQGDRGGDLITEYLDCRRYWDTGATCSLCPARCGALFGYTGMGDLADLRVAQPLDQAVNAPPMFLWPQPWQVSMNGVVTDVSGSVSNIFITGDPPAQPQLELALLDRWRARVQSNVLNQDIQIVLTGFVRTDRDYEVSVDYVISEPPAFDAQGLPIPQPPFTERIDLPEWDFEFTATYQLRLTPADPFALVPDEGWIFWDLVDVHVQPEAWFGGQSFPGTYWSDAPQSTGGLQFLDSQRFRSDANAIASLHVESTLRPYLMNSLPPLEEFFMEYVVANNPVAATLGAGNQFILALDAVESAPDWEGSSCDAPWNDQPGPDPDDTGEPVGLAVTIGAFVDPPPPVPAGLPAGLFSAVQPNPDVLREQVLVGTFGFDQTGTFDPNQELGWELAFFEEQAGHPDVRPPTTTGPEVDLLLAPLFDGLLDGYFNLAEPAVDCSAFADAMDDFCMATGAPCPGTEQWCEDFLVPEFLDPDELLASFDLDGAGPPPPFILCASVPNVQMTGLSLAPGMPGDPNCPDIPPSGPAAEWKPTPSDDLELVMNECLVATGALSADVYLTIADRSYPGQGGMPPRCPATPPNIEPFDLVPPPFNGAPSTVWQPLSGPNPLVALHFSVSGSLSFGVQWEHRVPFMQHLLEEPAGGPPMVGWDPWFDWYMSSLENEPISDLSILAAFGGSSPPGKHVETTVSFSPFSTVLTSGSFEVFNHASVAHQLRQLVIGPPSLLPLVTTPPVPLPMDFLVALRGTVDQALQGTVGASLGAVAQALSAQVPNWAPSVLEDQGFLMRDVSSGALAPIGGLDPFFALALGQAATLPPELLLAAYLQDPVGGALADQITGTDPPLIADHDACLAGNHIPGSENCIPASQMLQVGLYQALFTRLGMDTWGWPLRHATTRTLFEVPCDVLATEPPGACGATVMQSFVAGEPTGTPDGGGAWLLTPQGVSGTWVPGHP